MGGLTPTTNATASIRQLSRNFFCSSLRGPVAPARSPPAKRNLRALTHRRPGGAAVLRVLFPDRAMRASGGGPSRRRRAASCAGVSTPLARVVTPRARPSPTIACTVGSSIVVAKTRSSSRTSRSKPSVRSASSCSRTVARSVSTMCVRRSRNRLPAVGRRAWRRVGPPRPGARGRAAVRRRG